MYALLGGAIAGGIIGGGGIQHSVELMFSGAKDMLPAVLRILAAGMLAGVLMESGASVTIAETIIKILGEKRMLWALAISTYILTASGVFIYVAVITIAPIALSLGIKTGVSKPALLLAMIGGGKSGNIVSPNPNSLAVSGAFKIELTSVMFAGLAPSIIGIIVTVLLALSLKNKKDSVLITETVGTEQKLPTFLSAISGPMVALVLLAVKPVFGIAVDPLIALPAGGIAGAFFMGKIRKVNNYASGGLKQTLTVAVILLCTGCIAGIIANSELKNLIIRGLQSAGISRFLLPPISAILMSGATASTTSGAAVASAVFGSVILSFGITPLAAAAMINAGATVLDHMPHGSFFHASSASVHMNIRQRIKLIPYESLIGLSLVTVSSLIFYLLDK